MSTTIVVVQDPNPTVAKAVEQALKTAELRDVSLTTVSSLTGLLASDEPLLQPKSPGVVVTLVDAQQHLAEGPKSSFGKQLKAFKETYPMITLLAIVQGDVSKMDLMKFDCDFVFVPTWQTVTEDVQLKSQLIHRFNRSLHYATTRQALMAAVEQDEVSPLFNRQFFINRLKQEVNLTHENCKPMALVVINIDFYTVFLDTYGYETTMALVNHVAEVIQKQIRDTDVVARLRDDEIAVLLPGSTELGAKIVVDRMVKILAQKPYQKSGISETLSIHAGIAGLPLLRSDDDIARLIEENAESTESEKVDADGLIRYARHALHNARFEEDEDAEPMQLFSEIPVTI